MSRKIHHGHNGSYKTSGALNDDLLPAVEQGRTVVSNVRGLSDKSKIIKAWYLSQPIGTRIFWKFFPLKAPDIDFDLIYIDTEDKDIGEENMEHLRRWMEWVPKGSLIIFDEIDEIYEPSIFTAKKLLQYDYPARANNEEGTLTSKEASIKDGRWQSLKVAFSKHRHYNLDMIFTCTSIDNVHPMIKKGADMAYRHFNMANAGVMGKGKYREIAHSPDNKGATEANEISNVKKIIPKHMFDIYQSTSTGKVTDTIAGTSLWKGNRKVRYLTYLIVALLLKTAFDLPKLRDKINGADQIKESSVSETINTIKTVSPSNTNNKKANQVENNNKTSNIPTPPVLDKTSHKIRLFADEFLGKKLILAGKLSKKYTYFRKPKSTSYISSETIEKVGLKIEWLSDTAGFITSEGVTIPFQSQATSIADFCCLDGNIRTQSTFQFIQPQIN